MRSLLVVALLLAPLSASADPVHHLIRGLRVTIAPPAYRYESPPPAPSRSHIWIAGTWTWREGRHEWHGGHWVVPPQLGYVWEPARWEQDNGAWVYYEGYWRGSEALAPAEVYQPPPPPVQEVVVMSPPPPPIEEVQTVVPWPGAVWLGGSWHWNGARYVWISGRWSAQPPGYTWNRAHWDSRPNNQWVHRQGSWDHHDERREERREDRRDDRREEHHDRERR
jgi:hypothetical protein